MKATKTVMAEREVDSEVANDPMYKAVMRGLEDLKKGKIVVWRTRSK